MKTIFLILIQIFIVFHVHNTGKNFYNNRIKQNKTTPKIYDIGEKYIPDLSHVYQLHILLNMISILPLCFGTDVFNEFLLYFTTIILIRHIFISVTILPKNKNCDDKNLDISNFLFGHCYDKIFSGHYATIALLSLILLKYGYNKIFLILLNILTAFLIIATRSHYSIDILVAGLMSIIVYQNKLTFF